MPTALFRNTLRPLELVEIPEERPTTRKPNKLEVSDDFTDVIVPKKIQIRIKRRKASKNVLEDYNGVTLTTEYLLNSPVESQRRIVKRINSNPIIAEELFRTTGGPEGRAWAEKIASTRNISLSLGFPLIQQDQTD